MENNKLSFEEMEQVLTKVVKNGMAEIHSEERVKYLKYQKEEIDKSEECYKTSRNQLQRQFTI